MIEDDGQRDKDGNPTQPLMNFYENADGKLCVALWGWDTKESFDGYTTEDIDELIEGLKEAKKFILNSDDDQGEFDFDVDKIGC